MRAMKHITSQYGLSLIEVLIAVVVLAIGLLGLAGMQSISIQNNYLANQYSSGAIQAQALVERMRGNPIGVIADAYDLECGATPPVPEVDCAAESCTPEQMAAWDLATWHALITGIDTPENTDPLSTDALPAPQVAVACAAPCNERSPRNVTVCWDSTRGGAENLCVENLDAGIACYDLSMRP
jgi:type IV pilus assembly protein PilV